jgi:hypothetical protein
MVCTVCEDKYEASYDCDVLGHETDEGEYDVEIDGDVVVMYKCKHCGAFYN